MAMGEDKETAKRSWADMLDDMDDGGDDEAGEAGNKEIELPGESESSFFASDLIVLTSVPVSCFVEWLAFYKKSLKDAPLLDVLKMLEIMKVQIAENKAAEK